MKNFILILCLVLCFPISAAAGDSFTMKLSYNRKGHFLQIDMERLSRDEVKDVMQKLVIWVNEETRLEEEIKNQNHLNQITKQIPLDVQPGDVIKVVIHYGYGDTAREYSREVIVGENVSPSGKQPSAILIPDESVEVSSGGTSTRTKLKLRQNQFEKFGYEMDGNQDYGQKDFGYEGRKNSYGYERDDRETQKK